MKKCKSISSLCLLGLLFLFSYSLVCAEDVIKAPSSVQAALFLKLLAFNKGLIGDVSVYVMNDAEFAAELNKGVGKAVGTATLASVKTGTSLPESKPAVIYCGDGSKVDEVIAYSRSNKILSISGLPEASVKGITLVVGTLDSKPKILLNLSSAKEENVDLNPAILKISTVSK